MFDRISWKILASVVTFTLVATSVVAAAATKGSHRVETGSYQQVGDINVYYGVLPAQIAGNHPVTHEERTMHGGVPPGKDKYHLVVALYDASGKRITNAVVTAAVGDIGLASTRKNLEPMRIADTTSFGNYFTLRKGVIYRISIEIRRNEVQGSKTIEALFDYRLQ